ncbi:RNA polymerase sigma-70 factor [Paenibacillus sp. MBLB4367]|uniref:RNA polymerase sigma-70 factor n=1 Tax=Paenibacillus sp. MBLB4367 TaxID=3384767 RepID=UPI00390811BA
MHERTADLYVAHKPLLLSLAYRMLGSLSEAEDIVHEAFLAFDAAKNGQTENVRAYLCKIVTNRCIDRLRKTKSERQVYVGPWLPEPWVDGSRAADPQESLEQKDTLSTAFLLLLEKLTAAERAVFVLREALDYEYGEIAGIVGKSEANCRQLLRRARMKLAGWEEAQRPQTQMEQSSALVNEFVDALSAGDAARLLRVFTADAALLSDGGGKVIAAKRPILGPQLIATFLVGVNEKRKEPSTIELTMVNGLPGLIQRVDGSVHGVYSFAVRDGLISAVYIMRNPDKLRRLND